MTRKPVLCFDWSSSNNRPCVLMCMSDPLHGSCWLLSNPCQWTWGCLHFQWHSALFTGSHSCQINNTKQHRKQKVQVAPKQLPKGGRWVQILCSIFGITAENNGLVNQNVKMFSCFEKNVLHGTGVHANKNPHMWLSNPIERRIWVILVAVCYQHLCDFMYLHVLSFAQAKNPKMNENNSNDWESNSSTMAFLLDYYKNNIYFIYLV